MFFFDVIITILDVNNSILHQSGHELFAVSRFFYCVWTCVFHRLLYEPQDRIYEDEHWHRTRSFPTSVHCSGKVRSIDWFEYFESSSLFRSLGSHLMVQCLGRRFKCTAFCRLIFRFELLLVYLINLYLSAHHQTSHELLVIIQLFFCVLTCAFVAFMEISQVVLICQPCTDCLDKR